MFRHFFAEPIPAEPPFNVSTHGPGVYATRDGREVPVTEKTLNHPYCWRGKLNGRTADWDNAGKFLHAEDARDLVRYIGPLPEPEKWAPTCELEWRPCAVEDPLAVLQLDGDWRRLEQRWTCGDREEWRAIGVKQ